MVGAAWTVAGLENIPRGEIEEKHEAMLAIVEGRMSVYLNCQTPGDVLRGLALAEENGFLGRTILVLGSSAWKAADAIKAAGVSVVLSSTMMHVETDPITEEETETFVPKVMLDKGIPFALSSRNASSQSLWFQAALCVGQGMTREQALASISTTPAEMLGLGGRVGSLAKGSDGDIVLYSGDPLSVTSFVEYVLIDGEMVYDRSKDSRAQYLLDGVKPEGTAFIEEDQIEDIHAEEKGDGKDDDQEDDKDDK